MSLEISKGLLAVKKYSGEIFSVQLKVVYSVILQKVRSEQDGECKAGMTTKTSALQLAEMLGVSRKTIFKYLTNLESMQLIKTARPKGLPVEITLLRFKLDLMNVSHTEIIKRKVTK